MVVRKMQDITHAVASNHGSRTASSSLDSSGVVPTLEGVGWNRGCRTFYSLSTASTTCRANPVSGMALSVVTSARTPVASSPWFTCNPVSHSSSFTLPGARGG